MRKDYIYSTKGVLSMKTNEYVGRERSKKKRMKCVKEDKYEKHLNVKEPSNRENMKNITLCTDLK